MNTIDERVVQMQFNNSQFESGVQTSLKSLDALKKGLNLEGAARGLENLDRAGRAFSLDGIGRGVEAIQSKFTALSVIGITALSNITNSAINAGKRIVSALTIDPIKTGFTEYETKMNAIQTILTNTASKGTTLDDVNKTLADLNTYSDKTIYNFAEMTRNIGTFTAAGIDLKTSATAIKGIANLAAGSGSNAQQASTAMYQLSQALASGSVKLMDWNSVVNAGMGGELFQNALKDTAKQMGVVVDAGKPFRETLQDGWLTADVLTKTLQKFADDPALVKAATEVKTFTQLFDTMKESVQSGWATTWEHVIGSKDEAAKTLTAINDAFGSIVGSSADARNNALAFWHAQGGRDTLINALTNAFRGLGSILKPIGEAFRSVFPAITGTRLLEITAKFHELMANFKIGEKTSENLKNTFKGLFAIVDIVRQAFVGVLGIFGGLFKIILPLADGILAITGALGKYIFALNETIKASGVFKAISEAINKVFSSIGAVITAMVTAITVAFEEFANIKTAGLDGFADRVKARLEPFKAIGGFVETIFGKIGGVLEKISPKFEKFASIIGGAFKTLQSSISNSVNGMDFNGFFDLFNAGLFSAILIGIRKIITGFGSFTSEGGPLKSLTSILDGVRGSLEAYQSNLQAKTLLTIAAAIGILSVALIALSMVDPKRLTGALAAIGGLFTELFVSMTIFEKATGGMKFKGIYKLSGAMVVLSTAILILSFAMRNLASLDWNGIAKGLVGITVMSGILVASAYGLEKAGKKLMKGSLGLIVFATAIKILAGVVKELGALDTASLTKGLIAVGVLVGELAVFLKVADLGKSSISSSVGLIALSIAINILAEAVEKFGSMNIPMLVKGLGAMAIVLTELSLFTKATGNAKNVISTAIGLTILGVAMNIFATALAKMGAMPIANIGKGLVAMSGALLAITIAMNLMPKNMIATGAGLIAVSTAMLILSNALTTMGQLKSDEIARGLAGLAGSLALIVVSVNLMTSALPGAAALLVVSGALAILAPVLKTLGSMSLSEIGMGLLAMAGAFTVIGLAALVLAPVIPAILGLGAGIALVGVGFLAAGAGILAFSAGLAALAVSGAAGAAALVVVITSVVSLIPMFIQKIGEGIVLFANVIATSVPAITGAITAVITAITQSIIDTAPMVITTIMNFLDLMLKAFVQFIPKLVEVGMKLILGILEGVRDNVGKIVDVATDIIVNFIDGISRMLPKVIQAGFDLILKFINGLADSIRKNTPLLIEAVGNLMNAMLGAAVEIITAPAKGAISIGKDLVKGIIDGVTGMFGDAVEAVKNLGSAMLDGIKEFLDINSPSRVMRDEVGRYIVMGIAEGITKDMSAEQAATQKAQNIINAFKSALSQLDISLTTSSLEYDLWSTTKGDTASGLEKAEKELALLNEKFRAQQEKTNMAKAEYETMLNNLGSNSTDTQEAYNRYLTQQIELGKLNKEIEEARKTEVTRVRMTTQSYYEWMNENSKGLLDLGYSMKEIEAAARDATGYAPAETMAENMATNVESAVTTAMDTVNTVYEKKSEKTFGGLLSSFADWGGSYAEEMGGGFVTIFAKSFTKIKEKLDTMDTELDVRLTNAMTRINSIVNGGINTSPTIRPVLDLSNVQSGGQVISDMLTPTTGISVGGIKTVVSSIASLLTKGVVGGSSTDTKASSNTSVSFTQNNYSPTPLSRVEIYRQTKNQVSALKGLVSI